MSRQEVAFDEVMEIVGNEGPFQNRFNGLFNGLMIFFGAMLARSFIISMNVPDHWCHVAGRENTNFTIDEWKNLTLPKEVDDKGLISSSNCRMYDVNWTAIESWEYVFANLSAFHENIPIKECDKYEYDKRWYGSTVASEENWVCDNDMAQTNTYAFNSFGDMIGLYMFGRLGDKYGRRIVFFVGIATTVTGRLLTAFLSSNLILFRAAAILAALGDTSIYFVPYVIAMEISRPEDRSRVAIIQCIAWTAGMCSLPFVFWIVREWFTFYVICSLPLLFFYFIPSTMIESPRWLITRGDYKRAAYYLNQIAKVNKRPTIITETLLENMMPRITEVNKDYGILSLFKGWRLAVNTIVLILTWMICAMTFNTLTLYIQQSDGNPFLNNFGQSIAELPSYFVGVFLIDRIGRRWTNWTSSLTAALFTIPAIIFCTSEHYSYVTNMAVVVVQFSTTLTYFVVGIQGTEMYPTCLRQTGFALCAIGANISTAIGPYIVYVGQKTSRRFSLVFLFVIFIIGCFAGLYLPETLHQQLPDSIEDAQKFGKDQKILSFPKAPPPTKGKDEELESLQCPE